MKKMKFSVYKTVLFLAAILILSGCATHGSHKVGPTPIEQAKTEISEEQLMDVGILVFESKQLTPEDAKDEGTSADIRKAETHFIPYHLKNTLHQSGHWGAIQVVPAETNSVDLLVKGKILESNGENLVLEIDVVDATGKRWFKRKYSTEVTEPDYSGNQVGEKDAHQDLYNTIANDLAKYKMKQDVAEIKTIRTVSKLKFAREFAPDALMDRLLKIREREYMYVDTLNQQYDGFYNEMWPAYENWRKLNLTEREAIKKIKREALTKQLLGALLVAGAVVAGSKGSNTGMVLAPAMAIIGGQVFISGWNVSKEAEMHSAAIEELSESFGSEMQPVTMEFEGQQYELTGSAEEQFKKWKLLLRQIYFAETGFDPIPSPEEEDMNQDPKP
jgi:hypothetical protein